MRKREFRLVSLVRERKAEDQIWCLLYALDLSVTDNAERAFRAAVDEYLRTDEGKEAIKDTQYDFNWGDSVMFIPDEVWQAYGIYSLRTLEELIAKNKANLSGHAFVVVDQDEVLIPGELLDELL